MWRLVYHRQCMSSSFCVLAKHMLLATFVEIVFESFFYSCCFLTLGVHITVCTRHASLALFFLPLRAAVGVCWSVENGSRCVLVCRKWQSVCAGLSQTAVSVCWSVEIGSRCVLVCRKRQSVCPGLSKTAVGVCWSVENGSLCAGPSGGCPARLIL